MLISDCGPQLHIAAYHATAGYNNDTPGLGLLCALSPASSLAIGRYRNSWKRPSDYAAITYQPVVFGPLRVGVLAGIVTGYRPEAIPVVAAVASLPTGPLTWHLTAVPSTSDGSPAVAELSVSFKF